MEAPWRTPPDHPQPHLVQPTHLWEREGTPAAARLQTSTAARGGSSAHPRTRGTTAACPWHALSSGQRSAVGCHTPAATPAGGCGPEMPPRSPPRCCPPPECPSLSGRTRSRCCSRPHQAPSCSPTPHPASQGCTCAGGLCQGRRPGWRTQTGCAPSA